MAAWYRAIVLVACLGMGTAGHAFAGPAAKDVSWKDLVPPISVGTDPYRTLPPDQVRLLQQIENGSQSPRARSEFGGMGNGSDTAHIERELRRAGVDPQAVIFAHKSYQRRVEVLNEKLVTSLDGMAVRLSGYLLPLEFSGSKVSSFLLVPFVGACIHVPPPPTNQMVFVTSPKPFKVTGLYDPVTVTGRISAKPARTSLYLVDGASSVNAGYSLEADKIEPRTDDG